MERPGRNGKQQLDNSHASFNGPENEMISRAEACQVYYDVYFKTKRIAV
jgi:hypothetical protein